MLKRIIPFLEINGDELIVNDDKPFTETDTVELARFYESAGADEILLVERSGLSDRIDKMLSLIDRMTKDIFIPVIAAGGIDSVQKIKQFIRSGCTKICINQQALKSSDFLREASELLGSEKLILSVHFRKIDENWEVYSKTGKALYPNIVEWAQYCENFVSEIILKPFNPENPSNKLNIELAKVVSDNVKLPVLLCTGYEIPKNEEILQLFNETKAKGIISSNMFHFRDTSIRRLKQYLKNNGFLVRPGAESVKSSTSKHTGAFNINLQKDNKENIELLDKIKKASENQ